MMKDGLPRIARCPKCGADVTDYQTGEGPVYCPWCDGGPSRKGLGVEDEDGK